MMVEKLGNSSGHCFGKTQFTSYSLCRMFWKRFVWVESELMEQSEYSGLKLKLQSAHMGSINHTHLLVNHIIQVSFPCTWVVTWPQPGCVCFDKHVSVQTLRAAPVSLSNTPDSKQLQTPTLSSALMQKQVCLALFAADIWLSNSLSVAFQTLKTLRSKVKNSLL